jgi:hypothetical protein
MQPTSGTTSTARPVFPLDGARGMGADVTQARHFGHATRLQQHTLLSLHQFKN